MAEIETVTVHVVNGGSQQEINNTNDDTNTNTKTEDITNNEDTKDKTDDSEQSQCCSCNSDTIYAAKILSCGSCCILICVGLLLPIIILSTMPFYTDVTPQCSFENVTSIRLSSGIRFKWGFDGSVNASGNILNLNLQMYCGTFKRYLTQLQCNGQLVAATYFDFITYKQASQTMDHTGNVVFTGDSGSYLDTLKNNFGSAYYGIKSTKTSKTIASFTGSSWWDVDINIRDNNGYLIYSVHRDKYPFPTYMQINKLNTSDLPIEYLTTLMGSQTFYNKGNGDSSHSSTDTCNSLCLTSFYFGIIPLSIGFLVGCYLLAKKCLC